MADENNTQQPTDQTSGTPQTDAAQALDDLTVLSNVENQSLGNSGLNVMRAVDTTESPLNMLANVHQGETLTPTLQKGVTLGGAAVETVDVGIETGGSHQQGGVGGVSGLQTTEIDGGAIGTDAGGTHGGVAFQGAGPAAGGTGPLTGPTGPATTGDTGATGTHGPVHFQAAGQQAPAAGGGVGEAAGQTGADAGAAGPTANADPILTQQQQAPPIPLPTLNGVSEIVPVAGQAGNALLGGDQASIKFGVAATNPDGSAVTADEVQITGAQHGTVTVNADGTYTYTENDPNFSSGTDSFVVKVTDAQGGSVSETITVQVDAAPVDTAGDATGTRAAPITGDFTATQPDGLGLTTTATAAHGTVTVHADGTYTYTQTDKTFTGTDTVTFTTTDSLGSTTTATAHVNIGDGATIETGTTGGAGHGAISGAVSGSDQFGDTISYSVADGNGPAHGSVALHADGTYTYTPTGDWVGGQTDSFTVTVADGHGGTTTQVVTVSEQNFGPTDAAGTAGTFRGGSVSGSFTATDADGDATHTTATASHGSVTVNADGTYTYTETDANFTGKDTVSFTTTDGHGGTTTVTTTVDVGDGASVETGTTGGSGHGAIGGKVTGADAFGDTMNFSIADGNGPAHGTVELHADGSYTYKPTGDWVGGQTDSFTVTVDDGHGGTTTQVVTVTETNVGPADTAGATSVDRGQAATGSFAATDGDGDATHTTATAAHGSVTVNADGTYTYTETDKAFTGTDTVTFTTTDGHGGTTTATASVTIGDGATIETGASGGSGHGAIGGAVSGSDQFGDKISYSVAEGDGPANGKVELHSDGTYTYTPTGDWVGGQTDSFTVTVSDNHGGTTTQVVTVTETNVGPTDSVGGAAGDRGASITGKFIASDAEGDATSTTATAEHGTVTVDAQGHYTYTETDKGFTGTDTVTFTTSDGHGGTTTVTANVEVGDGATITTTATGGSGDGHAAVGGAVSGSDQFGDSMRYSLAQDGGPAHGSVEVNADGSYTYTPGANWQAGNGVDSFTVTVDDGHGGTTTQVVTVNLTDNAPTIDSVTGASGHGNANIVVNASDTDGDTLSGTVVSGPAHGTVSVNADGSLHYTDTNANWQAGQTDSFTVKVDDGHGGTTTQTVTVTDTDTAPTIGTVTGTSGHGTADVTVMAGDADGDKLVGTVVEGPTHGTLSINADNSIHYTDTNANWQAGQTDTFTVQASDGHGGTTTKVITVTDTDAAPTDTAGGAATDRGQTVTGSFTATDSDGDATTTTATAAHGSVTVNADGTYTYTETDKAFTGTDTVTFTTSDGHGGTTTVTANVEVGDGASITIGATGGSGDGHANVGGAVTGSDQFGDKLTYTLADNGGPAHGTVSVAADGSYTYTPASDWHAGNGVDSFTVKVDDGHGGTTTQTVTVNLTDASPVAGVAAVTADGHGEVKASAATATDADNDKLTYTLADNGGPAHGTVSVAADGSYTYTPGANWQAGNGADSFTVQVSDGHGGTTTQTVSINLTDAGPTVPGTLSVEGHGAATHTLGATDQFGDKLTETVTSGPSHGAVTVDDQGNFHYTDNNANFQRGDTDSFQVTVSDGHGGTKVETITVKDSDASPTVSGVSGTSGHGATDVTVSAKDTDGDKLTETVSVGPTHGTVSVNADGSFHYTDTSANWHAGTTDTFTVKVDDGHGGATTQTVTVTDTDAGPTVSGVSGNSGHGSADVTVSATDTDGDRLTESVSVGPTHGTVTANADGSFHYTDTSANWQAGATDTFTVKVDDGHGGTTTQVVTVTDTDAAPTIKSVSDLNTDDHHSVSGTVVATDGDAGDTVSYHLLNGSNQLVDSLTTDHGTVSINETTGKYTYTNAGDSEGEIGDSFKVVATDNHGGISQSATVNVNVEAEAETPTLSASLGTPTATTTNSFSAHVVGSDAGYNNSYGYYVTDADGHPTSGQILFSNVKNGGDVTITGVDPDHVGFFIIPNGASDNTGTHAVTNGESVSFQQVNGVWQAVDATGHVLSGDGAPVLFDNKALNGDKLFHMEDVANTSGNVVGSQNWEDLSGGGDKDYNDVNVTWNQQHSTTSIPLNISASGGEGLTYQVSGVQGATLMANGVALTPTNGVYTVTSSQLGHLSLLTGTDYNGGVGLTVTATSHDGESTAAAKVTLSTTVAEPVDHAPTTTNESLATNSSHAASGSVIASDVDGNALHYAVDTNSLPQHGSVALNPDGTFTYTANSGYVGGDSFNVLVSDGHGGQTSETITINPVSGPAVSASNVTVDLSQTSVTSISGSGTVNGVAGNEVIQSGASATTINGGGTGMSKVALSITDALGSSADTLGTVTVSGLPSGATLSAGTHNTDGSYTLSAGQLAGLTMNTPTGTNATLSITATEIGAGGNSATASASLSVSFTNMPSETLTGGAGNDTIIGGWGHDTLDGGGGANLLVGGSGDNTFIYEAQATWSGSYYSENVGDPGHAGPNTLFNLAGYGDSQDIFQGSANGHNVVHMGSGNEALFLDDSYSAHLASGARLVNIQEIDAGATGNQIIDLTSTQYSLNSVTIVGNDGNDVLMTSGGNNVVHAGAGNNYLWGGSGDDVLTAGNGNNTIASSGGNDTITVGNGTNIISEGSGNDTITAGGGNNTITATGHDEVTVGDGNNTVSVGSGDVSVGHGTNTVTFTGNADGGSFSLTGGTDTLNLTKGGGSQQTINIYDHATGTGMETVTVNNNGASGGENFHLDFSGHDTSITGGTGTSWTDVIDVSGHSAAGTSLHITDSAGHSWTEAVGDHGTITVGSGTSPHDTSGHVFTVDSHGNEHEIAQFTNVEKITY